MDCPICYTLIENSCIGSCTHHFCYKCLLKWCYNKGVSCPVCKTVIREIRMDKEFDSLNNPDPTHPIILEFSKIITVDFSKINNNKIKPGITLSNNIGPGVRVRRIKDTDLCYVSGIRPNDILLFINNVPCTNHVQTVDIIEEAFKCNKMIKCEIMMIKI